MGEALLIDRQPAGFRFVISLGASKKEASCDPSARDVDAAILHRSLSEGGGFEFLQGSRPPSFALTPGRGEEEATFTIDMIANHKARPSQFGPMEAIAAKPVASWSMAAA